MRERTRRLRRRRPRNAVLRALARGDHAVMRALRTRGHAPLAEAAMRAIGTAGDYGAVWAAIALGGAALEPERRAHWLIAAAIGPAAVGVNFAVKATVGRERPLIEGHPPLGRAPTKLSFPSAHATSSLAAATAIGRIEPRLRAPLSLLAATVCIGRPYLGMHYPSDVLAGAALGAVLGRLAPGLGPRPADERLIDLAIDANRRAAGNGAPAVRLTSSERGPRPA